MRVAAGAGHTLPGEAGPARQHLIGLASGNALSVPQRPAAARLPGHTGQPEIASDAPRCRDDGRSMPKSAVTAPAAAQPQPDDTYPRVELACVIDRYMAGHDLPGLGLGTADLYAALPEPDRNDMVAGSEAGQALSSLIEDRISAHPGHEDELLQLTRRLAAAIELYETTQVPVTLVLQAFRNAVDRFPDRDRWPGLAAEGMSSLHAGRHGWPSIRPGQDWLGRDHAVRLLYRGAWWGIPHCALGRAGQYAGNPDGCLSVNPDCRECRTAQKALAQFRQLLDTCLAELEAQPDADSEQDSPEDDGKRMPRCAWCGEPCKGKKAKFCCPSHRQLAYLQRTRERDAPAAS